MFNGNLLMDKTPTDKKINTDFKFTNKITFSFKNTMKNPMT